MILYVPRPAAQFHSITDCTTAPCLSRASLTKPGYAQAFYFYECLAFVQREGRSLFQFLKEDLMSKWKTIPYGIVTIEKTVVFSQNSRAKTGVCTF